MLSGLAHASLLPEAVCLHSMMTVLYYVEKERVASVNVNILA